MSEIIDFQELRLQKMRKELQEEIDITLAWANEVALRNGWQITEEGEVIK